MATFKFSGTRQLQALGRLKPGEMNKTEAAFAEYLERRKLLGEILWWKFDAVKLRLADNTFLTVDFFALNTNSRLFCVDVKGSPAIIQEDAKVKLKVAAKEFPWAFFMAWPLPKRDGGGWHIEEV